jgi:hypothetical protein
VRRYIAKNNEIIITNEVKGSVAKFCYFICNTAIQKIKSKRVIKLESATLLLN